MANKETSEVSYPSPSDEVEAYPLVLKLCSIDWATLAAENPDSDRVEGFAIAAAYCSIIFEDLVECQAIGKISGIESSCARRFTEAADFTRPKYY
jgi:hypothetical protein